MVEKSGYVEEEDEDFLVNESELGSESESSSSEEEEKLDKNGKRGECGATTDEEEEEQLDKNGKRGECGATTDDDDEETDKKVSQKVRSLLNSLDITPKTLKSKRKKLNRALQQSKIMRLSRNSRNRFTFDGANNVNSNGNL